MRWRGERESQNVEDRRDEGGGFGIVGILIILGLMLFFGIDPRVILQGGGGDEDNFPNIQLPQSRPESTNVPAPGTEHQGPPVQHPQSTSEDDLKQFVSVVLADTEDVWQDLFKQYGQRYSDPKLVLYSGAIRSACGLGQSAMTCRSCSASWIRLRRCGSAWIRPKRMLCRFGSSCRPIASPACGPITRKKARISSSPVTSTRR